MVLSQSFGLLWMSGESFSGRYILQCLSCRTVTHMCRLQGRKPRTMVDAAIRDEKFTRLYPSYINNLPRLHEALQSSVINLTLTRILRIIVKQQVNNRETCSQLPKQNKDNHRVAMDPRTGRDAN